jgi:predicted metal-dependent phosphoesterase TrpH
LQIFVTLNLTIRNILAVIIMITMKTPAFQSNSVAYQDTFSLSRVWKTIDDYSCPYHYNFHMHTVCSDGQLTPEQLIEQALKIGLKGLAITDHHSVDGFARAHRCLEKKRRQKPHLTTPYLWTGIEITSNLNGTDVHILGYGFSPEHSALDKYITSDPPVGKEAKAEVVINSLHEAGGLVVLAHPARYRRSPLELIEEAFELGIDGVETYYAYGNPHPWRPSLKQSEVIKQQAGKYKLFNTCGTDTHGSNLLVRL